MFKRTFMMLMILCLLAVFAGGPPAFAMTSVHYSLVSGDFNGGGGGGRTSSGYLMSLDALGEIGGSAASSPQYALWGGGVAAVTDSYAPFGSIVLDNGTLLTKYPTVNVHLEAMDNNGVVGYYLSENSTKPGVADPLWTAVTPTRSLSADRTFALSAGDGAKTVYAWFKDLAGNISTSAAASITLATSGPAFSATQVPGMVISALPDGSHTMDGTLNVTGVVADLSNILAILVGSDPVTINPDGSFSVAVTLVPGINIVQITIIDKAGNQATISRTIYLDLNDPALAITSPADGTLIARNYIDITGSADPSAILKIVDNGGHQVTPSRAGVSFSATANLDAGLNTITIIASLNGATQTAKRTVFYDFRKPGLSVTSPDKDVTVINGNVTIAGVVTDALTDVTVKVSADGADYLPTVVSNSTFTQAITFAKEGIYPVTVIATDQNGNSSTVRRNVQYQRGYVVINKGTATTTSTTVSLDLSYLVSAPATTTSTMQLLYNNTAWTAPMAFAAKKTITLPLGDGVKTVSVLYADNTGTRSAFYSDTIILDSKVPLGSVTINNGDAVTTSPNVTLSLVADDTNGVVKMQFSNNGTTWTAPEPFAAKRAYILPGASGTKKTVYARFIDASGKISAEVYDSIFYAVAPGSPLTNQYVVIKGGAPYTTTATVPVAITNPNPSTYTYMRTSLNGTTWGSWALWSAQTDSRTLTVTLPSGDGVKSFSVQFRAGATGTPSSSYNGSIILDTIAPKGTIQINDGAYSTNSRNITLTLTASDLNGVAAMQFSQNNLDWAKQQWMLFSGTTTTTLVSPGDGVKTVWVKFKDNAGKVSAAYSDTVLLDTKAPTGTVLINAGAKIITSLNVTLSLSATGATYMQWHFDDVSWNDNAWEPFAASKKITFPTGDGTKDVYVRFRDITGNESQSSAHASAGYTKTQAPGGITVPVSSLVTSYTVTWSKSLTADGTTGVTYLLQEATNDTFTTGLRTAYSGTALSAHITYRTKGRTYYYRVQARKTGYASSDWTTAANGCAVGP